MLFLEYLFSKNKSLLLCNLLFCKCPFPRKCLLPGYNKFYKTFMQHLYHWSKRGNEQIHLKRWTFHSCQIIPTKSSIQVSHQWRCASSDKLIGHMYDKNNHCCWEMRWYEGENLVKAREAMTGWEPCVGYYPHIHTSVLPSSSFSFHDHFYEGKNLVKAGVVSGWLGPMWRLLAPIHPHFQSLSFTITFKKDRILWRPEESQATMENQRFRPLRRWSVTNIMFVFCIVMVQQI